MNNIFKKNSVFLLIIYEFYNIEVLSVSLSF